MTTTEKTKEEKEVVSAVQNQSISKTVKVEDAASAESISVPFDVTDYHKKALVKLFHCRHTDQVLTYAELSSEIGAGEKTKAWQCVAWKDLKGHEFLVPAPNSDGGKTKYMLSEKGMQVATRFLTDEELADLKMPETNEEHHEKIKSRLMKQDKAKKYGPKIFDLLLETQDTPMNKLELAAKLNTQSESHGFFYGLQALRKMGLVCNVEVPSNKPETKKRKAKEENDDASNNGEKKKRKRSAGKPLKLTEKAFLATVQEDAATPN